MAKVDPISTGLQVLGTVAGVQSANRQANEAKSAANAQKKIAQRLVSTSDEMRGMYDQAVSSGFFDPEATIRQLEADTANYEARDAGGVASAWTRAGGSPNDTPLSRGLSQVKIGYRDYLDRLRLQVRQSKFFDKMNALGGTTAGLQGAAGIQGNVAAGANANRPDLGGFAQKLMPFLSRPQVPNAPAPAAAAPAAAAAPSPWSLGTGGGYMNFSPSPNATKRRIINTAFSFG